MKYISLFSGIGAFEKALDRLNIDYELVNFCEFDKYAIKSYCAIHGVDESKNLGDITKVDEKALPKDIDLVTYGFPCQDISLAGKQKGLFNEDGSKTRSGLFFEALRIIEETKPRVAIAENVKNLTSKKFNAQFQIVLESLEQAGYNNYWHVLNAKDYGVPQNRERVFIVSIRKDIDNGCFKFPEGFPLELRLKDMLEETVDEKFYLSEKAIQGIKNSTYERKQHIIQQKDWCDTLLSRDYKDPKCIQVADLNHYGNDQMNRVYSTEGLAPTVLTKTGGGRETKVLIENPEIITHIIPQTVRVRKYEVDCKKLCECLRNYKALTKITNQYISSWLSVPITKVEHWFRQDDSFAIPDSEIWEELKDLLEIETDEFDESIMTFEEKEGVYEKSNRVYDSERLSATVTRTDADMKILVREATKQGYAEAFEGDSINLEQPNSKTRRGRVGNQVAQTLTTSCNQAVAVAMRGRYAEDGTIQQNIEVSEREYANALTTVQKDSLVAEPSIEVVGRVNSSQDGVVVCENGIAPTHTAGHGNTPKILCEQSLRIRKLTPKECFRLMDFYDEDYHKAESVNSNTQLYKQAGNSIVVACPYYIFKALIDANILIEKENQEMELKVNEVQLPEKISFNYEELKQELTSKVSMYETMVYTDDQIKAAKTDKANLKKLQKALNDERIRREREYMAPFNDFKTKVNEIIGIIDKPVSVIDQQVKAFDEKQKAEKLEKIKEYWSICTVPDGIVLEEVFESTWLNASVSMKSIQESIDAKLHQIEVDFEVISNFSEYNFEAKQMYIRTLDLSKAMEEVKHLSEIAKRKAAYEAEQAERQKEAEFAKNMNPPVQEEPKHEEPTQAEPKPEEKSMWIPFVAYMTVSQAFALKRFFTENNIEFKPYKAEKGE